MKQEDTLQNLLDIRKGITAFIGGGGKTTMLRTLGELLQAENRVLLCTSTKIFPFQDIPRIREDELKRGNLPGKGLWWCGTDLPDTGKVTAPVWIIKEYLPFFDYILVEADGSAGRPMKAHAQHEPVIPEETDQVICLVGASGFGEPVSGAAHRAERYAQLAGCSVEDTITPQRAAAVLCAEGGFRRIFVNQLDSFDAEQVVLEFAKQMHVPVCGGSLQQKQWKRFA